MIHGVGIPYILKPSSRAKRLIIRVREGQVMVSVPKGMPLKKAVAFIETKSDWVFEQWQASRSLVAETKLRVFREGDLLPYLGRRLSLHIAVSSHKHLRIELHESTLLALVPEEVLSHTESSDLREAMYQWYKMQAREILWHKLDHFAQLMGVEYRQFRLKEQKTMWGSCSTLGNINLNWRIILGSEEVADYLVVHELAHLRYFNHSKDFWHEVEQYVPNHRSLRRWLKKYGSSLRF